MLFVVLWICSLVFSYSYGKQVMVTELLQSEEQLKNGFNSGFEKAKDEYSGEFLLIKKTLDAYYNKSHNNPMEYILADKRIREIIKKSNPKLGPNTTNLYVRNIIKHSKRFGISPVFVAAVIHRESNFRESLVSSANCRGPMQVGWRFHKEELKRFGINSENELHTIKNGVLAGCYVLSSYLNNAEWDYRLALKKYVGAQKNSCNGYIKDIFQMATFGYSIS